MLMTRIIPCLDVRDGRVVKGVQFQSLRDAGCPVERAQAYEVQGADEIVVLDVSATTESRRTGLKTIEAIRQVLAIPMTAGGGVRTIDDARALLDAGADKVSMNTAAIHRPEMISEMAERFGRQCTVVAVDAARAGNSWEVVTHAGTVRTGVDAVEWARSAAARGAGEILLTSWDRDGTGIGYDTDLLRSVSRVVQVPIIASGGAATLEHLIDAILAGADAVLMASILHDAHTTVVDIKAALSERGVEVRM